jgi:KDO2-lipid IV(A) lauroyltransferase
MASLKHNLEYLAVLAGVRTIPLLPPGLVDRLAVWMGSLAFNLLGSRRRLAFDNIKQALPGHFTDEELLGIVRRVFQNLGRTFFEFARFPKAGVQGIRSVMVEAGLDKVLEINAEGKGQILVTAHFGNWEMLGAWTAFHGIESNVLVYRQHNAKVNKLVNDIRSSLGAGIIEVPAQTKEVFRSLQRGGIVAICCDQHAPAETIVMDFLGRPAAVARGPALFAVRRGCPITPFMMIRERYDRHIMVPGQPIYPPNSGDEEADIRAMTAAWVSFFEKHIREHPDQWMWTHNRWKVKVDRVDRSEVGA